MAALSACPNNSIAQYYILIKQGIYKEYVQIDSWKTNTVFIVEGMDKTIISENKSCGGIGTYYRYVTQTDHRNIWVDGVGFMAQDITFRNTAGPANYQAVALRASGNTSTFYRCQFDVRKPMKGQYIAITAQQRNDNGPTRLVLQNCTLRLATPDAGDNVAMYLGRPWGNFSRTIIMQSYIYMLINPRGWIEFVGSPRAQPYYLEYQNKGVGEDIRRRVKWASTTNDPRIVSNFTVRNFINGDKWIPSTVPHYLDLL
ncbi:hypothetical protein H5410_045430 [Solanum commersonii]|uniref:Pectinesterase catalytic domain-containing protein n=1 Tax=Solanum commersonii TaxID=4109 RepID=A0A9J5XCQ4_SOLCO|nr:hypothetical protein H5410_045430 [Solanum commersonii]